MVDRNQPRSTMESKLAAGLYFAGEGARRGGLYTAGLISRSPFPRAVSRGTPAEVKTVNDGAG
jgi:hypothetical protein